MSKSLFKSITSYSAFLIRSKTKHSVHSPFIFEFIEKVLENIDYPPYINQIHSLKKELCKSSRVLETTDFGVSESQNTYATKFLTVGSIARSSTVRRQTGELLYNLANHFKPVHILELGTSFGFSTLFLAAGNPEAQILTLEGCAAKVDMAKSNFKRTGAKNIEVLTGRFDARLPVAFERMPVIDLVFLDGHHQYRPTMYYLNLIFKHIHEDTIVVMDDIHWSAGMERAWEELNSLAEVTASIDLYHTGILFFRKGMSKQQFILRYS